MSYHDYWHGDPWMARAFAQAYLLKRKVDNEQAWIQGAYVYNALCAALTTTLSKQRRDYVKHPLDFYPKTEMELEMEKREKRRKLVEFLDSMRLKKK